MPLSKHEYVSLPGQDGGIHLSGHFETTGFVAKFESKNLALEVCASRISVNYDKNIVSRNEVDALIKHISGIMEIMQHTNQEKE